MTNPTFGLLEWRTRAKGRMTDPIIEAAKQALLKVDGSIGTTLARYEAEQVVAAVTPLIRAQVLEEAAQVVEKQFSHHPAATPYIANAIRALKEQP